jgi:hypothetical protein
MRWIICPAPPPSCSCAAIKQLPAVGPHAQGPFDSLQAHELIRHLGDEIRIGDASEVGDGGVAVELRLPHQPAEGAEVLVRHLGMGDLEERARVHLRQQIEIHLAVEGVGLHAEILRLRLEGIDEGGGERRRHRHVLRSQVLGDNGRGRTEVASHVHPARALRCVLAQRVMVDHEIEHDLGQDGVVAGVGLRVDEDIGGEIARMSSRARAIAHLDKARFSARPTTAAVADVGLVQPRRTASSSRRRRRASPDRGCRVATGCGPARAGPQ